MYQILEISNGQPMIFEPENETVTAYSIISGRVHSKGVVFKDVFSGFTTHRVNLPLISYTSIDNSLVIIHAGQNNFKELAVIKNKHCHIEYNNHLFVFTLVPKGDFFDLKGMRSDDFSKETVILSGISKSTVLSAVILNNKIGILTDDTLISVFDDIQLDKVINLKHANTSSIDSNGNAMFQKSNAGTGNTHSISKPEAITDIKSQNTISNRQKTSALNTNNFMAGYQRLQREHKETIYNYNRLKEQHNNLQIQYNKLSDYTGQLQEQIRKLKLTAK